MEFKDIIVQLRKVNNYSIVDLADKLQVSTQTIVEFEEGELIPDIDTLKKLSHIFNVTIDQLVGNASIDIKTTHNRKKVSKKNERVSIKKERNGQKQLLVGLIFILIVLFIIVIVLIFMPMSSSSKTEGTISVDFFKRNEFIGILEDGEIFTPVISAGRYFSLVLSEDGFVSGSGDNEYGQLDVDEWKDIIAISAGGYHSVALDKSGQVFATGYNTSGQTEVSNWMNISKISAGRYHTLALTEQGTVLCAGENKYGQCETSEWSNVIDVSAGRYNSYALLNDGTVISTDSNDYGQANVSEWSDVKSISAGTYHVVGLTIDGDVLCVGGQDRAVCEVSEWVDISSIDAGGYHTLAVDEKGQVFSSGNNSNGQLNVSEWENIVTISGGRLHSLAITKDGGILSVGNNDYGQLNMQTQTATLDNEKNDLPTTTSNDEEETSQTTHVIDSSHDDIVSFSSKHIEELVRNELGNYEGTITKNDLSIITKLSIVNETENLVDLLYMPNLEELYIKSGVDAISTESGEIISSLVSLKRLYILGSIEYISFEKLINLTVLDIDNYEDNDLSSIVYANQLTEIKLRGGLGNIELNKVENLKSLSLSMITVSEESQKLLTNLVHLDSLHLYDINVDLAFLEGAQNLKYLSIDSCDDIYDFTPIISLSNLTELRMFRTNIATNFIDFSQLNNLRVLNLEENFITDVSILAKMNENVELNLAYNNIDDWSPVDHIINVVGRP